MTFEPYEAFDDPYCYKGTFVLKNKARLRDAGLLRDFELEMTALRAAEPLPDGSFDTAHYRAVHHHQFQDVYGWAGRYRTVRTAKSGNAFCYPEQIESEMEKLFDRLRTGPLAERASFRKFVTASASFLADLNAIHCFRDGNGRAQLNFFFLLSQRAGHPARLRRLRRKTFLPAMVRSFSGKLRPLEMEVARLCGPS